jgi:Fe-S oxidoreductase
MQLPLLDERAPELESCAFCPKLSRAVCPVSAADGRETTTPWGKMSAAYLLSKGAVEASASQAFPPWACTSCFACREACDLHNDVAGTLLDARADLMRNGLAPEAASRIVAEHAEKTSEAERGLRVAIERARARGAEVLDPGAAADVRVLVGCLATRRVPAPGEDDAATDALVATWALTGAAISPVSGCCGAPLRAAGDRDGFVRAAKSMAAALEGAKRLVVVDAGCAHAIKVRYGEVEAPLPSSSEGAEGPEVLHLSELAMRELARIPELSADDREQLAARGLRWHDPCSLGRGLGVYEAPRAVITRLLGRAPDEFAYNRAWGRCSGGGGVVPTTYPTAANGIAEARREEHRELGGGTIATGCAASRKMLGRDGMRVVDLATLIARAFEPALVGRKASAKK